MKASFQHPSLAGKQEILICSTLRKRISGIRSVEVECGFLSESAEKFYHLMLQAEKEREILLTQELYLTP